MAEEERDSVTDWIASAEGRRCRRGPEVCGSGYFESLVRLARDRLPGRAPGPWPTRRDAALSAFDSFRPGARLAADIPGSMTARTSGRSWSSSPSAKALDQARHERQQEARRRQSRRDGPEPDAVEDRARDLTGVAGRCRPPRFAAMVVDECRSLMDRLRDESLRTVARLRMEGYTNEEG